MIHGAFKNFSSVLLQVESNFVDAMNGVQKHLD